MKKVYMYDKATDEFIRVKILGKNKAKEGHSIMYLVKDGEGVVGTALEEELFRS